jgi:glycosyltransferase involved in cell wall biosynthesis
MHRPRHGTSVDTPRVALFVLDTRTGTLGGTELNSVQCAASISERGHRAVILEVGLPLLADSPSVAGVEMVHLDAPNLAHPTVRSWITHFQRIRPDVVVLSKGWIERRSWKLDIAVRLSGARYLAWEHHPAPRSAPRPPARFAGLREAKRRALLWARRQLHVNAVQRTVCVSHAVFRPLTERFFVSPARADVIYPGVNFEAFQPDADLRSEARAQWGVPDDAIVIGTLGRLVPHKRNDLVLRTFAMLRTRSVAADLWLVIGGTGSDRPRLEALTQELGIGDRVRFIGWQENTQATWNAIDVFPLPSEDEGLGLTLIEAVACGGISLAADVGGMPEVFAGGFEHLVVRAPTAEAWADAIESLLRLPAPARTRLQQTLYAHVRERFDGRRQWLAMVEWIERHGEIRRDLS